LRWVKQERDGVGYIVNGSIPSRHESSMRLDKSVLAAFPAFAGFSGEQLDDIVDQAHALRFAKNAHVFEQGGEAISFFLLLDGRIRAYKVSPAGEQIVIRFVGPGEMFGVANAIGSAVYPANALAVVDSVALAWPSRAWAEMSTEYPTLAVGMMRMLGRQLQESQERLAEISNQEVERRVANMLLRLAAQGGRKEDNGIGFDFPISRQDIAEMTGTTLFTVSRILTAWEATGLVATGRQKIVIRDPHRLTVLAAGALA
jgi:CRP-like cAMP-binding protein